MGVTVIAVIFAAVVWYRAPRSSPPFSFLSGQRPSAQIARHYLDNKVHTIQAYSFPADINRICSEARNELISLGFKEATFTDPNSQVMFSSKAAVNVALQRNERITGVLEKTDDFKREYGSGWIVVTIQKKQEDYYRRAMQKVSELFSK